MFTGEDICYWSGPGLLKEKYSKILLALSFSTPLLNQMAKHEA